jgi:hypothetical protein
MEATVMGSPVDTSGFSTMKSAKQALDNLATVTSRWRSNLLAMAAEYLTTTFGCLDHRPAIRECILHCVSRSMPLSASHPLLQQQTYLIEAHQAWLQGLTELQQTSNNTTRRALVHMQIQHFYSLFILQTARDTLLDRSDRFNNRASTMLDLVEEYLTATSRPEPKLPFPANDQLNPYTPLPQRQEYCFALEYAILPTLLAICFKIRHLAVRHRALRLLRSANRREVGQWSGELYHYADAIIALEESNTRTDPLGSAGLLEIVIEEARYLEVSMVCGRINHEKDLRLEVLEYKGIGLPPLRLQLVGRSILLLDAELGSDF